MNTLVMIKNISAEKECNTYLNYLSLQLYKVAIQRKYRIILFFKYNYYSKIINSDKDTCYLCKPRKYKSLESY